MYSNGETEEPCTPEELIAAAEDAVDFNDAMKARFADPSETIELDEFIAQLGLTQDEIGAADD